MATAEPTPVEGQIGQSGGRRVRFVDRFGENAKRFVEYNPDKLTASDYDRMEDHPQVRACLTVVKAPLMVMPWAVECDDEDIQAFVRDTFEPLWHDLIRDMLRAMNYGFRGMEKVWETNSAGQWFYDKIVPLPNSTIRIALTPDHSFDGLLQLQNTAIEQGSIVSEWVPISPEKSFVFTYDKRDGALTGRARLKSAYHGWWSSVNLNDFRLQFMENYAQPTTKGRAPLGTRIIRDPDSGTETEIQNIQWMNRQQQEIKSSSHITLSNDTDADGRYQYDFEFMEAKRSGADYEVALDREDRNIARGLFVPDRLFQEGDSGSYSLAKAHGDVFLMVVDADVVDIVAHIEKYLIAPLVRYNFGDKAPPCKLHIDSLRSDVRQGLSTLVDEMVKGKLIRPSTEWLAQAFDQIGIPSEGIEAVAPPLAPIPGEPVVNAEQETREHVHLSVDGATMQVGELPLRRNLTAAEAKADFVDMATKMDTAEAKFQAEAKVILESQRDGLLKQVKDLLDANKLSGLRDVKVPMIGKYESFLKAFIASVVDMGREAVAKETGIKAPAPGAKLNTWVANQAALLADRHASDVKLSVLGSVYRDLNAGVTMEQVIHDATIAFNDTATAKTQAAIDMATRQALARVEELVNGRAVRLEPSEPVTNLDMVLAQTAGTLVPSAFNAGRAAVMAT